MDADLGRFQDRIASPTIHGVLDFLLGGDCGVFESFEFHIGSVDFSNLGSNLGRRTQQLVVQ